MELRTLEYFLAIAREGNITNAAKALHITQPTLSRQLAQLEKEFGRQLYTRSHKGIELTEQGILLQRYAESIVELAHKAEEDMKLPGDSVEGIVHIGAGETHLTGILARAMKAVHAAYPGVSFHLSSGTTAELRDNLIKGYYDVMLECELQDHAKLNVLEFPVPDEWGVVMPDNDPLAAKDVITPDDLRGRQVITSQQGLKTGKLADWLGDAKDDIDVVAEYRLPLNTRYLVQEGFGIVICYQKLIQDEKSDDGLCTRPLWPKLESRQGLVWRRALPNKQTQVFLDEVKRQFALIENA